MLDNNDRGQLLGVAKLRLATGVGSGYDLSNRVLQGLSHSWMGKRRVFKRKLDFDFWGGGGGMSILPDLLTCIYCLDPDLEHCPCVTKAF